jgi:hypothetical protein
MRTKFTTGPALTPTCKPTWSLPERRQAIPSAGAAGTPARGAHTVVPPAVANISADWHANTPACRPPRTISLSEEIFLATQHDRDT